MNKLQKISNESSYETKSEVMRKLRISEEERKTLMKKYEVMKHRLEGIDEEFIEIMKENEKNQKTI